MRANFSHDKTFLNKYFPRVTLAFCSQAFPGNSSATRAARRTATPIRAAFPLAASLPKTGRRRLDTGRYFPLTEQQVRPRTCGPGAAAAAVVFASQCSRMCRSGRLPCCRRFEACRRACLLRRRSLGEGSPSRGRRPSEGPVSREGNISAVRGEELRHLRHRENGASPPPPPARPLLSPLFLASAGCLLEILRESNSFLGVNQPPCPNLKASASSGASLGDSGPHANASPAPPPPALHRRVCSTG